MNRPVFSNLSTFEELKAALHQAETRRRAEGILREAKAQVSNRVLTHAQLQDLRDSFHWRLENGLIT